MNSTFSTPYIMESSEEGEISCRSYIGIKYSCMVLSFVAIIVNHGNEYCAILVYAHLEVLIRCTCCLLLVMGNLKDVKHKNSRGS